MRDRHTSDRRVWLGVILLVIGSLLLLDNLHIVPDYISDYLFNWQTFLIVLGAFMFVTRDRKAPGLILMIIGGFFLLRDLDIYPFYELRHVFWPIILIALGLSFVLRRRGEIPHDIDEEKKSLDYIDDFAIFGGRERTITSQDFRGGKITTVFGGSQIDLRNADLTPGIHVMDIFAMFGGTSIIVPPDWTVKIDVVSFLGGFSDERYSAVKVVPDSEKVLVIKGFVMLGGGEVSLTR